MVSEKQKESGPIHTTYPIVGRKLDATGLEESLSSSREFELLDGLGIETKMYVKRL